MQSSYVITIDKNVLKTTPLCWNDFGFITLERTVQDLEFLIEILSNNLTYQGNPYTEYQQFLYRLIKSIDNIWL